VSQLGVLCPENDNLHGLVAVALSVTCVYDWCRRGAGVQFWYSKEKTFKFRR